MMRRLTSAPKPSSRVRSYIVAQVVVRGRAAPGSRSARRRSAPGSSSPRPWRSGSRPGSRSARAAARRRRASAPALAPARRARASNGGCATAGSTPSVDERARHADAEARRIAASSAACSRAPARRDAVASCAVAPGDHVEHQRRVVDRRARTGRSDRATTRRRAGRSARRGRRWASGRRCRRTPPAGGSSRRCRTRAPPAPAARRRRRPSRRSSRRACGRAPTDCAVGPNAEFSVDEPIANSSQLVLPTMTAPAAVEPLDDRGVVGRHEAAPGSSTPRSSARPACRCCP